MSSIQKGDLLTREQLKQVVGGDGSGGSGEWGSCTVTVNCGSGSISCSGTNGRCHRDSGGMLGSGWVQCDDDPKVYC